MFGAGYLRAKGENAIISNHTLIVALITITLLVKLMFKPHIGVKEVINARQNDPSSGDRIRCPIIDPNKTQVLLLNVGSVRSFTYPTIHEYYYRNQVQSLEKSSNAQVHQIW